MEKIWERMKKGFRGRNNPRTSSPQESMKSTEPQEDTLEPHPKIRLYVISSDIISMVSPDYFKSQDPQIFFIHKTFLDNQRTPKTCLKNFSPKMTL